MFVAVVENLFEFEFQREIWNSFFSFSLYTKRRLELYSLYMVNMLIVFEK